MDFIGEAVSEFIGGRADRPDEAPSDPPYVQPPWVARWDGEAGSWIFINEATGERTWEKPVIEEAGEWFSIITPVRITPAFHARLTSRVRQKGRTDYIHTAYTQPPLDVPSH